MLQRHVNRVMIIAKFVPDQRLHNVRNADSIRELITIWSAGHRAREVVRRDNINL